MIDLKFEKTFIDEESGEDIYLLSIKKDKNNIETIYCKKDEFLQIFKKMKKIVNNDFDKI